MAQSQCHLAGECSLGECSQPLKPAGTPCNDGVAATMNDACTDTGECRGTNPCDEVECTPISQCHNAGVCDPLQGGLCSTPLKDNGTPCDDGRAATVNDACVAGECVGEDLCADVTCEPISTCHEAGVCQPQTGECTSPLKSDGAECDDGDAATIDDRCFDGLCSGLSR